MKLGFEEAYRCEKTGYIFYVYRKARREKRHKKWLYCYKCDKKHDFIKQ